LKPEPALKTIDFDYHLPQELIAQTPVNPRDHSRLMVVQRKSRSIEHRRFFDLPEYMRPGDVMVFNESRVIPARLRGIRSDTGGNVEFLILDQLDTGVWQALVKPGRRMKVGVEFELVQGDHRITGIVMDSDKTGIRTLKFSGELDFDQIGEIPVPPYIHKPLEDSGRYQTVYAKTPGSIAAPTAGLHFTTSLLNALRDTGVKLVFATLHVGFGSFRPIDTDDVRSHQMRPERFSINQSAVDTINDAKVEGRRVISVGTTATRLMEHTAYLSPVVQNHSMLSATSGWADIFITPGHTFKIVDSLITNFHLPKSTLLMLTSAFADRNLILNAYREAIKLKYRFYSLGDAMLVL
jgi:S-adenosylmethionine:tRNA ribosyltransferase-isomerase